ncbi:MAG: DUF6122 family protein [Pseudomonadota bacterium]
MIRLITHMILHFALPGVLAKWFYRENWKRQWGIMVSTMIVDLDHLLAVPVFDPGRCSIGFHPGHSYFAICIYSFLFLFPKLRVFSLGLLVHMFLDYMDCLWMGLQS